MVEVSQRSTLERLLDAIKEQTEAPTDEPPALPHRPTSRGRLPSIARMRQNSFGRAALSSLSRDESSVKLLDDGLDSSRSNSGQLNGYTRQFNTEKVDTEDFDYGLIPESNTVSELKGHRIDAANTAERNEAGTPMIYVSAVDEEAGGMAYVRRGDEGLVKESAETEGRLTDVRGGTYNRFLELHGSTRSSGSHIYLQRSTEQEDAFIIRRKRRRHDRPFGSRKDFRVWFLNSDKKWMRSIIQSIGDMEAILKTADGKLARVSTKELLPANPEILDGVDDLVQLSYVHKPAISYNLQIRYAHDNIYTSAGSMLIAVNPFREVHFQTVDSFKVHNRKSKGSGPHVFKIADNAHEALMKDGVNQSIIISGESGAGKTETARLAMQYLVTTGGADKIGNAILQANTILEAFGNATTRGNKNGSRFGKVVDIYFEDSGKPCGASFQVGFLEKSRIVHHVEGEGSFHIFYQLCEGADPLLRESLNLRSAKEFQYLNQTGCLDMSDVDCKAQFHLLRDAMETLGITEKEQESIFSMLAAVLWLGNVIFPVVDDDNESCTQFNEAVLNISKLLKCSEEELLDAISIRHCRPAYLEATSDQKYSQVISGRDALAQSIYEGLFEWLVDRINKSLAVEREVDCNCISIFDNPGFQSSGKNGLEQLYINYSHEFLRHYIHGELVQEEQEESISEGIDCAKISSLDNEECIELFEKGVFPMLDDECALAEGTAFSFVKNLRERFGGHALYAKKEYPHFGVCHDTEVVTYDATGFVTINRDFSSYDICEFLSSCMGQLKECHDIKSIESMNATGSLHAQKQSLISRWKKQFHEVMYKLDGTAQHFILCIKPNKYESPASYEEDLVIQQLESYGVVGVVRTDRSGFPTRLPLEVFASRFGILLSQKTIQNQDVVGTCVAILQQCSIAPQMYQVGLTKIFLHAGQIDKLEHIRGIFLQKVICLQKVFRGYKLRCDFRKKKKTIILLQALVRGWLVRKGVRSIQQDDAQLCVAEQKVSDLGPQREKGGKKMTPSTGRTESQILAVEAALKERENENALLQQSVQEYKRRWSEYEIKMKSMEEMWQKQIASLQCSLSASKKHLSSEDFANETLKQNELQNSVMKQQVLQDNLPHVTNTGNVKTGPHKPPHSRDVSVGKDELDPSRAVLDHLTKEFEHRTQVFNDDVDFLVEVKSGQTEANFKPDNELHKLKQRFDIWKKDFKLRLRETKGILKKLGKSESSEKSRKKWWGKKSS